MQDSSTVSREPQDIVVVVAYPGDETLWAGGAMLSHPSWRWHIVSMFRGSRPDSEPRFEEALCRLGATGEIIGVPEARDKQTALSFDTFASALRVLETREADLLVTHGLYGESRRLCGRDGVGRAVGRLWETGRVVAPKLWVFAYDDDNPDGIPYVLDDADRSTCLSSDVWQEKQDILLNAYGFAPESFVGKACPREEGFYCFSNRDAFREWKQVHMARPRPSEVPGPRRRGPPSRHNGG